MDVQAYLPGDAAVARINRSVEEYNSRRAELYSSISWRRPVLLGGYAVLRLALLVVIVVNGASMLFGIAFVAVPAGFIGLWEWVRGPAARSAGTWERSTGGWSSPCGSTNPSRVYSSLPRTSAE